MEDTKEEWHGLIAEQNPSLYEYLNGISTIGDKSNKYYLIYMAMRLIEMQRILKDTGSIYLHCDPTMSHFLKLLMDIIFGHENFRNEIVWGYRTGGISKKYWPRKHDIIFLYGKLNQMTYNPLKEIILYAKPFFTNQEPNQEGQYPIPVYVRDIWDSGNGEESIKPIINVSKERIGYPTQKPVALLERIIKASSNEGDLVLDPFCGCASTCIASEKLKRQWIGIDVSEKAYELVQKRLSQEVAPSDDLFKYKNQIIYRDDIPKRTDLPASVVKIPEVKHRLYGKQEGKCKGCQVLFEYRNMEIDHIFSTSKGGGDHESNLQLLCSSCNRIKGDRPMEYLLSELKSFRQAHFSG